MILADFDREPGSKDRDRAGDDISDRLDRLENRERAYREGANDSRESADHLGYVGAILAPMAGKIVGGLIGAWIRFGQQKQKELAEQFEKIASEAVAEAREAVEHYAREGFEKSHAEKNTERTAIDRMDKAQREGLMEA